MEITVFKGLDVKTIILNIHEYSENFSAACVKGDLSVIKHLLEQFNADINFLGLFGLPPLLVACEWEQIELAQFLLDLGASPNSLRLEMYPSWTTFAETVGAYMVVSEDINLEIGNPVDQNQSLKKMQFLIELMLRYGAQPNILAIGDRNNIMSLLDQCESSEVLFRLLQENGALGVKDILVDAYANDKDKVSLDRKLLSMTIQGDYEAVSYALNKGARTLQHEYFIPPLAVIPVMLEDVIYEHTMVLDAYLKHESYAPQSSWNRGMTALHQLAFQASSESINESGAKNTRKAILLDMITAFVEHSANINALKAGKFNTPLDYVLNDHGGVRCQVTYDLMRGHGALHGYEIFGIRPNN